MTIYDFVMLMIALFNLILASFMSGYSIGKDIFNS